MGQCRKRRDWEKNMEAGCCKKRMMRFAIGIGAARIL
jgi:hypothetical protein